MSDILNPRAGAPLWVHAGRCGAQVNPSAIWVILFFYIYTQALTTSVGVGKDYRTPPRTILTNVSCLTYIHQSFHTSSIMLLTHSLTPAFLEHSRFDFDSIRFDLSIPWGRHLKYSSSFLLTFFGNLHSFIRSMCLNHLNLSSIFHGLVSSTVP